LFGQNISQVQLYSFQAAIMLGTTNTQPPIPGFLVCIDVKLGRLLGAREKNAIPETWSNIEKNREGRSSKPAALGKPKSAVEAYSKIDRNDTNIVFTDFNSVNMLAQAVRVSFYEHYPVRLSPDVIWLTILQGLAKHISQDPERHRSNLGVAFQGKKKLIVGRPDFVKGSPNNDWTSVFPEFANLVGDYIGKEKRDVFNCDFTTSSATDQLCSHVVLMATAKHYFEYEMYEGWGAGSPPYNSLVPPATGYLFGARLKSCFVPSL
jgi:Domain of unknown function (DUF4419)